ncbi:MAG TPA: autotransporter-associated beta strand repeat-containing protein, partial [Pirellulales bacterium]
NTYSGTTTISAGTLQLGNATASGSVGGGAIVNNGALLFNRTDSYTLPAANTMSGIGSLTQGGSGTLILANPNTFTGDTKITAGTLQLAKSLALQNSTLDHSGTATSFSFGTLTTATLGGLKGSQSLALTNTAAANVTLTVGKNGLSTTYSGVLSGGGSLAKIGTGTLILAGANSYIGATQINQGVLQLGASNRIADTSNLILGGGTLATAGFNETLGTLGVNTASTINLGAGASNVRFADSHVLGWTGILTVSNWSGTWGPSGASTAGKLFVGATNSGLQPAQLANVDFAGYAPSAVQLPTGEVVPLAPMKGDFNLDHVLTSADLDWMMQALTNPTGYEAAKNVSANDLVLLGDFDGDSSLTNLDLQGLVYILNHPTSPALSLTFNSGSLADSVKGLTGTTDPSNSVPEPTSIILAAIGTALIVCRQRKCSKASPA